MEKETMIKTAKQILTFGIGVGAGCVVGNAVRFTTPANIGAVKRLCIGVASLAMGCMLGDKTSEYVSGQIDMAMDAIEVEPTETVEEIPEVEVV